MNHNYSFHIFIRVSYVKLLGNAKALIPIRRDLDKNNGCVGLRGIELQEEGTDDFK